MAESINAYCSVCGKGYYKCLSCRTMMQSQPWKQYTDTSEHYKIHQVVRGYVTDVYTKAEACERLKQVDLSDLDELRVEIREVIDEIMGNEGADAASAEQAVATSVESDEGEKVAEEVEEPAQQQSQNLDKRQMFNKNKKRH